MAVRVPATYSHPLFPKVGTRITPLHSCKGEYTVTLHQAGIVTGHCVVLHRLQQLVFKLALPALFFPAHEFGAYGSVKLPK